jgi:hypothetical protein
VLDREQAAQTLAGKLPSPSSYAKNGGWSDRKLARLLALMRTHRPAQLDAQPFQQLPVALSDRTLGQVEEDCAFATPSAQDTDFAQKLSFAISDSFADEAARMTKFWDMASREFGMHFIRIRYDTSETDGSATISAGQVLALGANLESRSIWAQVAGIPGCKTAAMPHCTAVMTARSFCVPCAGAPHC